MPCYSIQKSKVQFAQSTDTTLFRDALRSLGFEVATSADRLLFWKAGPDGYRQSGSFDGNSGQLELPSVWDVNEIKRAYSQQVVESQARKFGWQIQWSKNPAGHLQATVLRRA